MRPSLTARSSSGRTIYARMDYGNRVGFWRMLDVLNKHKVRACCCLNLELWIIFRK
jgi:allantoinase